VELRASLSRLPCSLRHVVCPPDPPPPPQNAALGAVPRLWHCHGTALGVVGDAEMSLSHDRGFPSRSTPNTQLLPVPGTGPACCPLPPRRGLWGQSSGRSPSLPAQPGCFLPDSASSSWTSLCHLRALGDYRTSFPLQGFLINISIIELN